MKFLQSRKNYFLGLSLLFNGLLTNVCDINLINKEQIDDLLMGRCPSVEKHRMVDIVPTYFQIIINWV
jgi:hypothetical protein